MVWLDLVIILFPQCLLAATPLSFSNFHPDALDFRAASKVAAADLENLHDDVEGGEDAPIAFRTRLPAVSPPYRRTFRTSAGGLIATPSPPKAKPPSIGCEVKASKFLNQLKKLQNVTVSCKSSCALNVGEADDGWQVRSRWLTMVGIRTPW